LRLFIYNLGWPLWAATLIGLVLASIVQWSASQRDRKHMAAALAASHVQIGRKLDLLMSRHETLLCVLRNDRGRSPGLSSQAVGAEPPAISTNQESLEAPSLRALSYEADKQVSDPSPAIPKGVHVEEVIGRELKEILLDERLNPHGKQLSRVEGAEATLELHRGQGLLRVLESEILLDVARAVDFLRQKAAYIDYAQGERYEAVHGVMTVAEPAGDQTRM